MRYLELDRLFDGDDGTIGRMGPWYVIEEEDQDNAPNISRIPAGAYVCRRTRFHRGGYDTFEVTGVRGRSLIKFHRANTEEDVEGCLGVGSAVGVLKVKDEDSGQPAHKVGVTGSAGAFTQFMMSMVEDEFILIIKDPK